MKVSTLQSHTILIVGLGVTGISVARFLVGHGLSFDAVDEGSKERRAEQASLLSALSNGDNSCHLFDRFDAELFCRYSLIVLSPGIARSHPAIQAALQNGTDVVGDIELFAGVVDSPVIAVTGSNGKSTVVAWLASTLQEAGVKAIACGNIGQSALDSLHIDAQIYVLELSSYQLESTRSLNAISATVLNVSDDHMDRYEDIEHYASVKRRVYAMSNYCVANYDDKRTWPDNWANLSGASQSTSSDSARFACDFFSVSASASDNARWCRATLADETHWLADAGEPLLDESALSVPGLHNVGNALALLALLAPLNLDFKALQPGLVAFAGLQHRSQYLGERSGVRWYNDSKGTNVDACRKAIDAMPGPVILIAGGMAKGADFSPLRSTVSKQVKLLILIGQDREKMALQLKGSTLIELATDLDQAVSIAKANACSGDVVLLSPACASFDMFKNFEDRGEKFTQAVAQVLAA